MAQADAARFGRNTGIASGLAAILHAVLSTTVYLDNHWMMPLTMPYLRSGVLGLGVFVLLLAASIKPLAKRVGWRVQALATVCPLWRRYSPPPSALRPFASRTWTLALYGIGASVSLIRLIPKRSPSRFSE